MISLLGIALFPFIAYLLSTNRQAISLRTVLGAFALQAGLGGLILYVPFGKDLLAALADKVVVLLGYSKAGIDFLIWQLSGGRRGVCFCHQRFARDHILLGTDCCFVLPQCHAVDDQTDWRRTAKIA